MHPFLKWPGGKNWLMMKYQHIFSINYNAYYEPFLGGGSAFFFLTPEIATISDINQDLINAYQVMSRSPRELGNRLEAYQEHPCAAQYYQVRNNIPDDSLSRAARFLYLNRTCFNGMYRVNHLGHFNVPIGTKQHFIDDVALFDEYARILQHAHIRTQDFVKTIREANEGDLVFADPPYAIAHNQNSFIKYNEKLFSWKDQKRLLNALVNARNRGALVVSTNAFYPAIQQMYLENDFFTQTMHRFSSISGSKSGRGMQDELLISSYPINL